MPDETQEVTLLSIASSRMLQLRRTGDAGVVLLMITKHNGECIPAGAISLRADELLCAAQVICGEDQTPPKG